MKRNRLHITILALLIVATPIAFLMFTEEGKRLTDNVILALLGRESVAVNLGALDASYGKDEIMKVFEDLEWQCRDQPSDFGDEACSAAIASFNDYPAQQLGAYFRDSHVTAVKITYQAHYHGQLLGHLVQQLGQPRNATAAAGETPDPSFVVEWDTGKGLVLMKQRLATGDEPAIVWLARGR